MEAPNLKLRFYDDRVNIHTHKNEHRAFKNKEECIAYTTNFINRYYESIECLYLSDYIAEQFDLLNIRTIEEFKNTPDEILLAIPQLGETRLARLRSRLD